MATAETTLVRQAKSAHSAVQAAIDLHSQAAHRRNLAGFVLVRLHEHQPAKTWKKMGVSRTAWYNELLPHAPVDSLLPQWTAEEAEDIIAAKVAEIAEIATTKDKNARKRIAAVQALHAGGSGLAPAEIVKRTGLSHPQVGKDIKAKDPSPAGQAGEGGRWVPAPVIADRLGVPVERFLARVEGTHRAELDGPPTRRDAQRILFEEAATVRWWKDNRHDWLSARELVEHLSAPAQPATYDQVSQWLRGLAEEETPPSKFVLGRTVYEPRATEAKWRTYRNRESIRVTGVDDRGRMAVRPLADLLGEPVGVVKGRVTAWWKAGDLPAHEEFPYGLNVLRVFEPASFFAKWYGPLWKAAVALAERGMTAVEIAEVVGIPDAVAAYAVPERAEVTSG